MKLKLMQLLRAWDSLPERWKKKPAKSLYYTTAITREVVIISSIAGIAMLAIVLMWILVFKLLTVLEGIVKLALILFSRVL